MQVSLHSLCSAFVFGWHTLYEDKKSQSRRLPGTRHSLFNHLTEAFPFTSLSQRHCVDFYQLSYKIPTFKWNRNYFCHVNYVKPLIAWLWYCLTGSIREGCTVVFLTLVRPLREKLPFITTDQMDVVGELEVTTDYAYTHTCVLLQTYSVVTLSPLTTITNAVTTGPSSGKLAKLSLNKLCNSFL